MPAEPKITRELSCPVRPKGARSITPPLYESGLLRPGNPGRAATEGVTFTEVAVCISRTFSAPVGCRQWALLLSRTTGCARAGPRLAIRTVRIAVFRRDVD